VLRRILRKFSHGVVLKRRLPKEFGRAPLFVSPEAALVYWRHDLSNVDPFLLSMVRELVRPNMTVWDIGANVGLFSFAAAALGANVLAVEPDTWLANLMHESVSMNKLPVTVLPAAVSDRQGIARLYLSEGGRASNSLSGAGLAQTVITVTLDSLLDDFPAPQVLKIDVEGLEWAALKGASRVLQARPRIFVEITDHHEEIGDLLKQAGYELHAARDAGRQSLTRPSRDTLAIPK
jgi:FkbM family methyltransferase